MTTTWNELRVGDEKKRETNMKEDNGGNGPSQDAVAARAYEIWERAGCPTGCDKEHWLQAETELLTAPQQPKPVPPAQVEIAGPVRSLTVLPSRSVLGPKGRRNGRH